MRALLASGLALQGPMAGGVKKYYETGVKSMLRGGALKRKYGGTPEKH